MTLEQLRIFVAAAEREHVTRAATALGLTQSAVSAAIAALEAQYHTSFFHRVGRRIELSGTGKLFLIEAKGVLARVVAAELALQEFEGLKRGTLSIYASQVILSYWLPIYLVRFQKLYPDIKVRTAIGNTLQVANAVAEGAADIGFVEGEIDNPTLIQEPVFGDRLVIVVAPSHPWAKRDDIDVRELVLADWVLREPGSGTRAQFRAVVHAFGLNPREFKIIIELPSNEAVRSAVECGAGATAISDLVVERSIQSGTLYRVPLVLPSRSFLLLRNRDRYHSKASQAFLSLINAPAERNADLK